MSTAKSILLVIVAVVLLVAGAAWIGRNDDQKIGSFQETYPIHFSKGLRVGENERNPVVAKELLGVCNAATTQLPLEATSTDDFTCSVPGAAAGDIVQVFLPSSSGSALGGFTISYTAASTDTITFGITNLTGAATSSFSPATTSVQFRVTDYY